MSLDSLNRTSLRSIFLNKFGFRISTLNLHMDRTRQNKLNQIKPKQIK